MSHTITCPSGLTGRIRGMKVREERVLADRKLAKSGGQVDALLGACWEETLDPGPYDFGEKDIDWGAVLQGDRFFALLQVRALTYGPTYAFALGCQNDSCRSRFEWELDLTELPVRPLSDESRAAFTDSLVALAANVATLLILRRTKRGEAHIEASWIFTSNDIMVNALVILAGLLVWWSSSQVPDLIAGGLIFLIVANGARRILALSKGSSGR